MLSQVFQSCKQSSFYYSFYVLSLCRTGFPSGSLVKDPPANAGDVSLIPVLGRSPGEGNGSPLQYSCLENSMDRGAWWAIVHGVAKESEMTKRLSNNKNTEHR